MSRFKLQLRDRYEAIIRSGRGGEWQTHTDGVGGAGVESRCGLPVGFKKVLKKARTEKEMPLSKRRTKNKKDWYILNIHGYIGEVESDSKNVSRPACTPLSKGQCLQF